MVLIVCATSRGIKGQLGGRNSPTVWNSKFWSVQFWDGRAKNLQEQAGGPIINPIEMGMKNHKGHHSKKLRKFRGIKQCLKKHFPRIKNLSILATFTKAIATFEETLVTSPSPYDKYLKGG